MSQLDRDVSLKSLIEKLPQSIGILLQNIQLPSDNGEALYEKMIDGTLVGASDGSLKKENGKYKGRYAFSLQALENDDGRIVGNAAAPISNDMTSLTTELYGLLTTVICIFLVWTQNKNKYPGIRSFPPVNIYLDNKEAIDKANTKPEKLNVSEFLKPEYDLEMILWDIQNIMPVKIRHHWVKGHQNERKDGSVIYGPFERHVQLNIEMDALASIGNNQQSTMRSVYTHTKMAVFQKDGVLASNLESFLYEKINGEILHTYIAEKYDWDDEVMQDIHWSGIGKALKSYTSFQRRKITQMMYEWQNDGTQKIKINREDGKCPACSEAETHLHHIYCQDNQMKMERKK